MTRWGPLVQCKTAAPLLQCKTAAPLVQCKAAAVLLPLFHHHCNRGHLLAFSSFSWPQLCSSQLPHPSPSSIHAKTSMEQQIEQIAGGENADFMEIACGDQVKMRRLTEIRSWFHNTSQMHWTTMATLKQMTSREKAKLPPHPHNRCTWSRSSSGRWSRPIRPARGPDEGGERSDPR